MKIEVSYNLMSSLTERDVQLEMVSIFIAVIRFRRSAHAVVALQSLRACTQSNLKLSYLIASAYSLYEDSSSILFITNARHICKLIV